MAHLSGHLVYFDIEISPLMNMEGSCILARSEYFAAAFAWKSCCVRVLFARQQYLHSRLPLDFGWRVLRAPSGMKLFASLLIPRIFLCLLASLFLFIQPAWYHPLVDEQSCPVFFLERQLLQKHPRAFLHISFSEVGPL